MLKQTSRNIPVYQLPLDAANSIQGVKKKSSLFSLQMGNQLNRICKRVWVSPICRRAAHALRYKCLESFHNAAGDFSSPTAIWEGCMEASGAVEAPNLGICCRIFTLGPRERRSPLITLNYIFWLFVFHYQLQNQISCTTISCNSHPWVCLRVFFAWCCCWPHLLSDNRNCCIHRTQTSLYIYI